METHTPLKHRDWATSPRFSRKEAEAITTCALVEHPRAGCGHSTFTHQRGGRGVDARMWQTSHRPCRHNKIGEEA